MRLNRILLIVVLAASPVLVGAQCAFFFSSGGGSSDRDKEDSNKGLTVVVAEGHLSDAPVVGIDVHSGPLKSITRDNGLFEYEVGNTVRFFIGDIPLGGEIEGKALIKVADLVADGDSSAAVNILRLLHSLDADPGDEVITIPASVRSEAVYDNPDLSSAIEFLDFSDETAFANSASQLVAVLTRDYPFTASLLDADRVRGLMAR